MTGLGLVVAGALFVGVAAIARFVLLERVFVPWMRRFRQVDVESAVLLEKVLIGLFAAAGLALIGVGVAELLR